MPASPGGGDVLVYKSIALLAAIALPVIAAVHWALNRTVAWPQMVFAATLLTGALLAWLVSRHGRREIAAVLLIGVLWTTATIYAFESGYGMHSSAVFIYLPCVLYTAFFFGLPIASAELALTVAALVIMYLAEESGRLGGAAELARRGANFNFLVGVVLTSIGTLIVSFVYHRRIERDTAALAAEAERQRAAADQARQSQERAEAESSRLRALADGLESRGRQSALETARTRRDIDFAYDVIAKDVLGALPALRAVLETLDVHSAARVHREIARIEAAAGVLGEFSSRGHPEPPREDVNLTILANDHIRELRGMPRYARMQFHVDPGLRARADREQAASLLRHLVKRACTGCLQELDPQVHVGSGSKDGRVMFFVRDNGPGMDGSQLEALFRPPGRGDLDNTMDIGIVSARRIAERHGGELWAESAPGRGTTYFFTLAPE